jgi:hypothetical protein
MLVVMVVLVFYPFLCDVMTLGLFFIFVFLLGLNDMVDRIFFSLVFILREDELTELS